MSRYAARTDNAHASIVADLRRMGYAVADNSRAGDGWPDLYLTTGTGLAFPPPPSFRGVICPEGWGCHVEVKSPGGELTRAQQEWLWLNRGPVVVAETADEIAAAIQALRGGRGRR